MKLRDTPDRVLDVALGAGFDSHDGFTRAFADRFGLTPNRYRAEAPPLPLFLPRSARGEYMFATEVETNMPESATTAKPISSPIFVRAVERPRRKFILLRGRQATDYMAYCEEVGCDIWGLLLSIKGTLDEPMGVWLPESLRRPGTSVYAQGVEVPLDYAGQTPPDCEVSRTSGLHVSPLPGATVPGRRMVSGHRRDLEGDRGLQPRTARLSLGTGRWPPLPARSGRGAGVYRGLAGPADRLGPARLSAMPVAASAWHLPRGP